ncbi:MAG: hypothetical protein NT010_09015 [Proteobacteria bacterium]|nr:hypothetical protein [Pseudomonadota bacterium]
MKISVFLFPNSHKRVCEFGLSGLRLVRNDSDVDEMQALQTGGVLNVRRRIARRSRSPQISISSKPLTEQRKN